MAAARHLTPVEAAAAYDRLGHGGWRADSFVGVALALEAAITELLVRGLHRGGRSGGRASAKRVRPPPGWLGGALDEFVAWSSRAGDPRCGLAAMVRVPALLELLRQLCRTGDVTSLRDLDARGRAVFEAELMPTVERIHRMFRPAEKPALQCFYFGVRLHFHLNGWGEPGARELRLLAAARELEPIEEGLDRARKRWEDRMARWRDEMDRDWRDWRAALPHGVGPSLVELSTIAEDHA
jgi:hypothetical protein